MKILSTLIPHYFDKLLFEHELRNKWEADRVALNIPVCIRPLYDTLHRSAFRTLGRFPDLLFPRSFNDRLYWLMLFDQTELAIACSDKIRVRDYVRAKVGEDYLTLLYGTYRSTADIVVRALPPAFVIKTNHDSGTVVRIRDASDMNFRPIFDQLETALRRTYGVRHGEWVYAHIPPQLLIEEFLAPESHEPPPDFKFHCVNGTVSFIHYITGRHTSTTQELVLDRGWKHMPVHLYQPFQKLSGAFETPSNAAEMIEIAERLSAPFKYVRVDLYNIENRIVFGELTFFPGAGTYHGYGVYQLDHLMRFSLNERRPPISDGLNRIDAYPAL